MAASVFQRVDRTTIAEIIKGEEVNIMRNNKVLALIESKSRATMNHSGKKMEWDVRTRRNDMLVYEDGDTLTFPRVVRNDVASLPWRGYVAGESIGLMEKEMNKGPEARVSIVAQITEAKMDDIRLNFAPEFFKDGNAAANLGRIHGFPSFLGYTSNAQYTLPSDTYAGLSTALAGLGGAATAGSWPDGQFDPEYDAWSPLIVNYTHASWSATTDNWANNCVEALRAGFIHNANTRGPAQGMLDLVLTTGEMYRQFIGALDGRERIVVERNNQQSPMIALGFRDVTNLDGVDITYEGYIPTGEAYGLKYSQMELRSLQSQLFYPSEDYDLETLSDRYAILFLGNLKCNPRGFVFWKNIT